MQPLRAEGRVAIRASVEAVHAAMLDPVILGQIIPGALRVTRAADGTFTAVLQFGVGFFRGRQTVALRLDEQADGRFSLSGQGAGPIGTGTATGHIQLRPQGGHTVLTWRYAGTIAGSVTLVGPFLLRLSATAFTTRVFRRLQSVVECGFS